MARLIDFFTLYDNWDYSKTDIAENSELSIRTVLRALPYLEQHGIVKHTRTVGKAEMYQINKDSPLAQHLKKLAFAVASIDVDQELACQANAKHKAVKTESITA